MVGDLLSYPEFMPVMVRVLDPDGGPFWPRRFVMRGLS